jgi:hypothetical protein
MPEPYVSPWDQALLLPERWRICGISCNALSLWHSRVLELIGNHYVCGGVPTIDSAASLLLFAQRNFRDGREIFLLPSVRARALRAMAEELATRQWETLDAACRDYVSTCQRIPDHKYPEDAGHRTLAAPHQFVAVYVLMSRCRLTWAEAWDTPFAVARCILDAAGEYDRGDDTLADPRLQRNIDEWVEKYGESKI